MTPRQFLYPRVVLEFYHTMTSRGAPSQMEIRFSIDSRPGVLRAADITAALGLPVVLENPTNYRRWCHAPNPGPTRLADLNRFPGRETQDWDFFFFFFKTELAPVGTAHIL